MKNSNRFSLLKAPWLIFWWVLIALISTTGLYYQQRPNLLWLDILPVKLAVWLFWGSYAWLIFFLARRFEFEGQYQWKTLIFHVPFSLFSVAVNIFFYAFIAFTFNLGAMGDLGIGPVFLILLPALFEWYFIVYWAIVLFTYTFDFYNRYRKKELQTLQLEKRLIQAQLQTLKMQLHPHFLFNTLNTVSSLVRQEQKGTAVSMLSGLSGLLRVSLAQRDRQEISLQEEIHFVKQYLSLEKERFGERMQVHYELEVTALEIAVPAFLLQPLVENAVYHGLAKKLDASRLEISAKVVDQRLVLQIYNDGQPIDHDFDPAYCNGIGLSNTLERLSQYYDGKFEFEIKNWQNGVMINMQLPIQNQDNG